MGELLERFNNMPQRNSQQPLLKKELKRTIRNQLKEFKQGLLNAGFENQLLEKEARRAFSRHYNRAYYRKVYSNNGELSAQKKLAKRERTPTERERSILEEIERMKAKQAEQVGNLGKAEPYIVDALRTLRESLFLERTISAKNNKGGQKQ
ncbi:MAG: hypothetical protein QT12_C0009G0010 [archaeon GW2011_AR21]|nr:MAG: hypothetical protein QT12_C0009G0010 [archaeon GW2011_AR21]